MKALQGQSIFDIAIQTAGSVEAAFALALLNGLNMTDDLDTISELALSDVLNDTVLNYYQDKQIKPVTSRARAVETSGVPVSLVGISLFSQNNVLKSVSGQTLFDIAIQVSGSAEAAFEMALINSIGITDELTPGTNLLQSGIFNKQISTYYQEKQIKPATSIVTVNASESGIFDYTFDFIFN